MKQVATEVPTTGNPKIDGLIQEILKECGVNGNYHRYHNMLNTVVGMVSDHPDWRDLKQFDVAMREMRKANQVFSSYKDKRIISIFGSARTKPYEPAYQTAEKFANLMQQNDYMVITGGGGGIMEAAQKGAGRENGFALNIELPFEQHPNEVIAGDSKLVTFRYFFTRKLNFLKPASAVALLPGGFGTMDEGFEVLTLIQTGKAPLLPIVMLDEPNGVFWSDFDDYLKGHLLKAGLVSEMDFHLFKITRDANEACQEILKFHHNFHSYRYVKEFLVLRMQRALPDDVVQTLCKDFADIIKGSGGIEPCEAMTKEADEPELASLPRLRFAFDRRSYGRLRQLINKINDY